MASSCAVVVEVDMETRQVRGRFSGCCGCATACRAQALVGKLVLTPLPMGSGKLDKDAALLFCFLSNLT